VIAEPQPGRNALHNRLLRFDKRCSERAPSVLIAKFVSFSGWLFANLAIKGTLEKALA
jgi:hypothetical protein